MTKRPVLMNGAMVRATLREVDPKTQTRRVVKMKQSDWCKEIKGDCWHPNEIAEWRLQEGRWFGLAGWYTLAFADCPYGQIGDRLWVRETWQGPLMDAEMMENEYRASPDDFHNPKYCEYAADGGPAPEFITLDDELVQRWKPSIHMPRWASRILLEIVSVRVERLQDISEDDAEAEGIEGLSQPTGGDDYQDYWRNYGVTEKQADGWPWFTGDRIASYKSLWESINGPDSWDANPWVWVIEFKMVKP
ncbi:MAG: hypothetical protein WC825_02250 [Gallionellaceae bacterium]|jgi:hypothetical protein